MRKLKCIKCDKVVLELKKGRIKPFYATCMDCYNQKEELPDAFQDIFGGFDKG